MELANQVQIQTEVFYVLFVMIPSLIKSLGVNDCNRHFSNGFFNRFTSYKIQFITLIS